MSIDSRLAVVETRIEQIMEVGQRREIAQRDMLDMLASLEEKVDDLNSTISRYKGFVGGVLFVVGAMATFISSFGTLLWNKLHG